MKIFITGGTGSIGAHLVKMLAEQGHTVHAFVRSLEKGVHIQFENVQLFQGNLLDEDALERAMQGCQQVYHLAAFAKVWAKDSGTFYQQNVQGTMNVLNACVKNKVEKVVVTSTAGIWGPSINGIITEEKVRDIDFFNEYEGSKSMAESRIKDYVVLKDLDVVIVSPTRVYGPFVFGELSSITMMIDKYVNGSWRIYPGTGKELGNYVYIMDVVLGHILAMEKGKKGETYILGGENHDYISFYQQIAEESGIKRKMFRIPIWVQLGFAKLQLMTAEVFGKEPVIVPKWVSKAKYDWEVSPKKAIHELGLPVTSLAEGLKLTIDYLKKEKLG